MTTKTKKITHAGEHSRSQKCQATLPPLSWWRNMRADYFNASSAKVLREQIAVVAIFGEPAWDAAVAGDAAAAIGLAFRLSPDTSSPAIYDLVMTALLACAAEDDAAACLAMSHVLRRCPSPGRAEARLATSWLVRNFAKAALRATEAGGSR